MKIDITSMFFNSSVIGTATAAWRTSIGQNRSKECRIETEVPGVTEIIVGMLHLLKIDFATESHMTKGGNNDELLISSVFEKVYVNDNIVPNCKYVLSLVREHTPSHDGRKELCYSPNLCYGEILNSDAIKLMASSLGCTEDGCWFVYDISVKNQDELHFSAIIVNQNSPVNYDLGGAERSKIWNALVAEQIQRGNRESSQEPATLGFFPLQQIFYGAPGTGKSHTINEITRGECVIRTTFHPDSDYSTFVGAYKPTMSSVRKSVVIGDVEKEVTPIYGTSKYEEKITYKFVKQAFLKAYLGAWKKIADGGVNAQPQYLIIEEINRGNCAQIFGDLFQLLDRQDNGYSSYPIEADSDLQQEIERAFWEDNDYKVDYLDVDGVMEDYTSNYDATLSEDILHGRILLLPNNLYIWATMNTSDQSLFPIDSAFKRRWDWQYMPIGKGYDENGEELIWAIEGETKMYSWWSFLEKINAHVAEVTQSEDKKLGFFFCKATDGVVSAEKFVGKVIFYLWNDVFKNNGFEGPVFKDVDDSELSFSKFYKPDMKGNAIVQKHKVELFLDNLGVEALEDVTEDINDGEGTQNTTGGRDIRNRLNVTFSDGETIRIQTCNEYIKILEKIGLENAYEVAISDGPRILGCSFVTKTPEEAILNHKDLRYETIGEYHIIRLSLSKQMQPFLEKLSDKYNLGLKFYRQ